MSSWRRGSRVDIMKQTIGIAGLGLMGGSLAYALKKYTKNSVIGIDCDESVLTAALAVGAVDKTGVEFLPEVHLLVLALAPDTAVEFLKKNGSVLRPGTVVTDICGVKRAVAEQCLPFCREHGLYFVGGHPMAGREKSGFEHADANLFRGASYIFTPSEDTPESVSELLESMALSIGCARVTVTTPEEHDRMIAFTSQLPHVLAGAYVKSPNCPDHKGFSAGSYRDVSRVAAVDEKLWAQLYLLNADNLCGEIDALIANLSACREAVAEGDAKRLEAVLREGRERKENMG